MILRALLLGLCASLIGCQPGETEGPPPPPPPTGNDTCKRGDDPQIIVGHGFGDYYQASDMDEAEVEAGPQGGYHIWIGARIRGLRQSGSLTELWGEMAEPDTSLDGGRFVFTLEQDEGGYCKVYGLRLIIADSLAEVQPLLGHPIDVSVEVEDKDGDVGVGERTLLLSEEILGL